MLGSSEGEFREFDQGAEDVGRAVRIDPRSPEALTSYGNVLLEQKCHDDAIVALGKAIRLQPGNLNALIYRGLALAESGRNESALKDFDRALQISPQSVFALHNRANALIALNRHKEARISIETLLKQAPGYVPALSNYAIVLTSEKKHREALAVLDRALGIEADNPELLNARGHALLALKRYEEALASYDSAVRMKPDSEAYQISRGNLFAELGRYDEALAAYERAIALKPDSPGAHLNRANMLMEQNGLEEALEACERSIALKPDYAPALVLKGNILLHSGRPEDAAAAYDRAVAEQPDYAEGHYHRGSALLIRGHFERGWRDFEHRWQVADCGFDRPVLQAREWRGEKLSGRSIIVYSEQGMGDAIQFARFLPRLAAMGAKVTFLCHPGLVRLFRPFAAEMEVIGFCEAERRFDFQCAMMSLPERLGTVPGVRLISLQKTHGLDQLAQLPAGMRVETLGAFDEGKDAFIDTAAIMQGLDLIITSDTSTAHLAGALGRPTWVALKHIPDWRFMLERGDSPWYPTMRLFRQPARDDWNSVFAATAEALGVLARASAGPGFSNIGS